MAGTHRTGRATKRLLLVLVLALGALPLLPGVASAHHAEISASIDCDGVVSFTAMAWAGTGGADHVASRTNTDIRVWYTVDGGPQVTVVDGGQFNQGNNFQFSGTFQAPAAGTIVVFTQAEANWANGAGPGGSRNTGALSRPTNCGVPHVVIEKTASKSSVVPGEQFDYTLTVTNIGTAAGAAPATDVRIQDHIPASLTILSVPANCAATGNDVTCDLGTLAPGASASVTFTVQANNGSCPRVDNTGTVSASNEPAAKTHNNSDSVSVDVLCHPDVRLSKSASATNVAAGDQFTYTLTAENVGNTDATDVQIQDQVPASLAIVSIPANCTQNGNTVTCDLGTLAAGASASVTFTVQTSDGSCPSVDNTGTVSASNEPAGSTGNNTSNTVTVNVACAEPDVAVVKSASSATVNAGDTVTFTIEARNVGQATANDVVITDTIAAGLQITGTSGGCTVNGQTVTCNVGSLNPGQSASITITVRATAGACPSVTNQASVSASNEPAGMGGNNVSNTVRLDVVCPTPDVSIRKSSNAPAAGVFVGDEFAYTITVENVSGGDVLDVVVTDTIPTGLTIVNVTGPCTVNGQQVTCNIGTVAAGASSQITIRVRAEEGACPEVTNRATVTASNDGNSANNSTPPVTDVVQCVQPGIAVDIVKTNDADEDGRYTDSEESRLEGSDVSFRLVITNVGESAWTLTDLTDAFERSVVELLNQHCAQLDGVTLEPGESVRCTFTLRNYAPPAETSIVNTAEVCVEMVDDSATTACDDDDSRVRSAEVLGQTVTPPPTRTPPGGVAFTGPDDRTIGYGLLAIALLLLGTAAMYAGHRKREGYDG